MAFGRLAARDDGRAPREPEAEHVAEVVQRIGQQRERVGREP
jgi:hypothetical protein